MKIIIATLLLAFSYSIAQSQSNIIGGTQIDISTIPWQVSLQNAANSSSHFCGGSIINDRWILTSAHCVSAATGGVTNANQIIVHAGSTDQTNNNVGQRITCDQIIVHPQFNAVSLDNDIAVLHLSASLQMNGNVQIVRYSTPCNTTDAMIAQGQTAALTGWGVTCNGCTTPSPTLKRTDLPIITAANAQAIQLNNSPNNTNQITNNMIPFYQQGTAAAPGDSGGPATIWDTNGNPIVIGTTSWGYFPKDQNPTMYSRIRNFTTWIQNTTGVNPDVIVANLTGPDNFCTSGSYNIINIPVGSSILWTSSNLSIATPNPNGTSCTFNQSGNGTITITATVNAPCGVSQNFTKQVHVGSFTSDNYTLSGNSGSVYFCPNQNLSFSVSGPSNSYTWTAPQGWTLTGQPGNNYMTMKAQSSNYPPTGDVSVTVSDPCTSQLITVSKTMIYNNSGCTPNSPYTISPNPASPYINIACTNLQNYCNISAVQITNVYGQVFINQSWPYTNQQVQVQVSGLQNGTYIAKIYDGSQWYSQQFIVQH